MLVFVSDLHLADGTCGASLAPEAVSQFTERLIELAEAASWRTDGTYRPIEQIELVLLGDTLDLIRSGRWLQPGGLRPWDDPQTGPFAETFFRLSCSCTQPKGVRVWRLTAIKVS